MKTNNNLKQENDVTSTGLQYEAVEVITTIYDRYRTLINKANSGYINGVTHPELMEILRYTEKIIGHSIPVNFSCPQCVIDLVKLFGRTENK